MSNTQHTADFDHLLRVCRTALKHGDRGPAERFLRRYLNEAKALGRRTVVLSGPPVFIGTPGGIRIDKWKIRGGVHGGKKRMLVDDARRKARRLAALLAEGEEGDLGTGLNPWAEAQKARRRPDPLVYMKLTEEQVGTVDEIRAIFEATVRAVMPGNVALDAIRVDTSIKKRDPWLNLPQWIAQRRLDVYLPWVRCFGLLPVAPGRRQGIEVPCVVDMVLSVLIDRESFLRLSARWHIRQSTLSRMFRYALNEYSAIARAVRAPNTGQKVLTSG